MLAIAHKKSCTLGSNTPISTALQQISGYNLWLKKIPGDRPVFLRYSHVFQGIPKNTSG
jgi:hypothetical protein